MNSFYRLDDIPRRNTSIVSSAKNVSSAAVNASVDEEKKMAEDLNNLMKKIKDNFSSANLEVNRMNNKIKELVLINSSAVENDTINIINSYLK